jgi:hypothetical protein
MIARSKMKRSFKIGVNARACRRFIASLPLLQAVAMTKVHNFVAELARVAKSQQE